jgi:NADPH-dependent ferric siderophore reductase
MSLVTRLTVTATERMSPSFIRVRLSGALDELGVSPAGTYDQRIKLVFAGPSGELPWLDRKNWWRDFRAVPADRRGHMRTYTLRAVEGEGVRRTIVVDFAVHPGAGGPGSAWALRAAPGDELIAVLPQRGDGGGVEWPLERTGRLLLAGDETAVPAICSILAALPETAHGAALLEVPQAADALELTAPSAIAVSWLARGPRPVGALLTAAVLEQLGLQAEPAVSDPGAGEEKDVWETPTHSAAGEPLGDHDAADRGAPYLWIAGETGAVGELRRTLTRLGWPRNAMSCMGYWRQGHAALA